MLVAQPRVDASPQINFDVVNLLTWRAEVHNANVSTVLAIAKCESTFNPYAVSNDGSYGLGQWRGGQAAWRRTPAYKEVGIDIVKEYRKGNPDAPYFDADQLAWAFSPEAPRDLKYEWTCYWKLIR